MISNQNKDLTLGCLLYRGNYFFFYLCISPPDSQESVGGATHRPGILKGGHGAFTGGLREHFNLLLRRK